VETVFFSETHNRGIDPWGHMHVFHDSIKMILEKECEQMDCIQLTQERVLAE
jgi:hypothetical protein